MSLNHVILCYNQCFQYPRAMVCCRMGLTHPTQVSGNNGDDELIVQGIRQNLRVVPSSSADFQHSEGNYLRPLF